MLPFQALLQGYISLITNNTWAYKTEETVKRKQHAKGRKNGYYYTFLKDEWILLPE